MLNLTPEEQVIVRKLLLTKLVKDALGAESWDLTDAEECKLWEIIERLQAEREK